jgi:hypothetical protein
MLISFIVREKKATSDPATKNDTRTRIITIKKSIVVAAGVITRKVGKCVAEK